MQLHQGIKKFIAGVCSLAVVLGSPTDALAIKAKRVDVDASGFSNNLSSADDTVQKALATLDALATAGQSNTASNQGVGGVGLFKQKTGVDLEFRNINAGSGMITVTLDAGNNEVDIDVDPSAIDHDSLSGFVANEHIDWTQDQGATNIHSGNYTDTDTQLSQEQVEDFAGGMVTGNTETLITVTYQDADGTFDFVVDGNLSNYTNDAGFLTANQTITLSGDISGSGSTSITTTIGADKILASMLKAVNTEADEDIVTYEATTGDFEFHTPSEIITAGTNLSWDGTTLNATDTDTQLSQEQVEDFVGGMLTGNTETLITVTYQDADGTIDFVVDEASINHDNLAGFVANEHIDWTGASAGTIHATNYVDSDTQLTEEQVEDFVGAMVTGNTETLITVTYQDADGTFDFAVEANLSNYTNDAGFLTGNETITLSGDVSGSGTTAITATIGADKILASMLKAVNTEADEDIVTYEATTGDFEFHTPSEIITAGTNLSWDGTTLNATDNDTQLTQEQVEDFVGGMLTGNTETLITVTYQDADGTIDFVVDEASINHDNLSGFVANEHIDWTAASAGTIHATNYVDNDTQLTQEQVEDFAGALIAAVTGTHTGITITYQDATGDIDFVVDHDAASNFVANEHIDHTAVTLTAGVGLSGGGDISANRTFTVDLNELTTETSIAATDLIAMVDVTDNGSGKITFANLEATLNHDSLAGFVANEHIDWTQSGAGTIHSTNYTDNDTQLTEEQVEDFVGGMLTGNTETLVTVTYQDADGTIDFVVDGNLSNYTNDAGFLTGNETITLSGDVSGSGSTSITTTIGADKILASMLKAVNTEADEDIVTYEATTGDFEFHTPSEIITAGTNLSWDGTTLNATDTDTQLSQEQVEDFAGGLVANATGTHTLITITYQDATGDIDFVVDNDLSNYSNATSNFFDTAGTALSSSGSTVNLDTTASPSITGTWDFSGGLLEAPNSTTLTSTDCDAANEAGRIYVDTDATSGQQLYVCEGTGGWVLQGDGTGSGLWTDGGASTYLTATGDLVAIGATSASDRLTVVDGAGYMNVGLRTGSQMGLFFGNAAISGTNYHFAGDANDLIIRIPGGGTGAMSVYNQDSELGLYFNGSYWNVNNANADLDWIYDGDNANPLVDMDAGFDTVTIGSNTSNQALLFVDGFSDEIMFKVQGHSTQTNPLGTFELSDGTDVFVVGSDGSVTGTVAGTAFSFRNTTDAASVKVGEFIAGDRATQADDDQGYIDYSVESDGGVVVPAARITWGMQDITDNNEDGFMEFSAVEGVDTYQIFFAFGRLAASWDAIEFNPTGDDQDFIINGRDRDNVFYVDSASDCIGIGNVCLSTEGLRIDVAADVTQLYMKAHSTQTSMMIDVANSSDVSQFQVNATGSIYLVEKAAANGDTANYGQIWVKNDTPNTLWYTDDAGTDYQLGASGGSPGGADTNVQYNDGGSFGGDAGMLWDKTDKKFSIIDDSGTATARLIIEGRNDTSDEIAFWNQATPSATNYFLYADPDNVFVRGDTGFGALVGTNTVFRITATTHVINSDAANRDMTVKGDTSTVLLVTDASQDSVQIGNSLGNGFQFFIDGFADKPQLHVQAHSTQTNNIAEVTDSSGTDLFVIQGDGRIVSTVAGIAATFQNTTDGNNEVAIFKGGDKATVNDNDYAFITYQLEDSAGGQQDYFEFQWWATDVTNGTEDTALYWRTMINGSMGESIALHNSSAGEAHFRINASARNIDFRYYSDAGGNTVLWDAANDFFTFGSSTDLGGLFHIDGRADEVQLTIDQHSTQTSDALRIRKSDGTKLVTVEGGGQIKYNDTAKPSRRVFIPARAGRCRTSNGCNDRSTWYDSGSNDVDYYPLFFDGSSDNFWQTTWTIPENYDGGTFTASVEWVPDPDDSSNAGGVAWFVQMMSITDNDPINTAFGTAIEVNDDFLAAGDFHRTAESAAITASGSPAGGHRLWIQVYRDVSDSDDDLSGGVMGDNAGMLGIWITYTVDAESTED